MLGLIPGINVVEIGANDLCAADWITNYDAPHDISP
jgi:hypothetical protein